MGPEASINNATDNAKSNAYNIGNPVVHIGGAVKAWLDELNHTAKGARPQKHWKQSKTASSGKGEGECCKGNEMYELIAPVWCWWRLV